ncbi:hypothetical protein [Nonomuraea sp. NPDC048901]|uniref:hypothetical protein n=1 Tax=Nonomuraea sp. NPDC048901 TaxID=3155627 RepID=UPI0033F60A02
MRSWRSSSIAVARSCSPRARRMSMEPPSETGLMMTGSSIASARSLATTSAGALVVDDVAGQDEDADAVRGDYRLGGGLVHRRALASTPDPV